MFLVVCVCLFVCQQDYLRIYMKPLPEVCLGPRINPLRSHNDHDQDRGLFLKIFASSQETIH